MNIPLYLCAIRHLLSQPVRLGALIGATVLPLLQIAIDPDPRLAPTMWSMGIAVIATAGIIGLEITTGSVALFFTRPLTRATYVVSRWSAAATVSLGMMVLGLAAECGIIAMRDGEISLAAFALALADRFFVVSGAVSVMACFSALASSLGDLVIWVSIQIVALSLGAAGQLATSLAWLRDISHLLHRIASPMLDLHRLLASSRVPWAEVTGYAATITLSAAIAILVMNRKELSYASE